MAIKDQSLGSFLDALGSKAPVPGGGTVGPVVGALAAALGQMVIAYSIGRKSLAEHQASLENAALRLDRARTLFLALGEADAEAYSTLNQAMKKRRDDATRQDSIAAAARDAIAPPRQAMAAGIDLLRLLQELKGTSNRMLASDLRIAAILAEATVRASAENVRVNLSLLNDETAAESLRAECRRCDAEARERSASILR